MASMGMLDIKSAKTGLLARNICDAAPRGDKPVRHAWHCALSGDLQRAPPSVNIPHSPERPITNHPRGIEGAAGGSETTCLFLHCTVVLYLGRRLLTTCATS